MLSRVTEVEAPTVAAAIDERAKGGVRADNLAGKQSDHDLFAILAHEAAQVLTRCGGATAKPLFNPV